MAKVTRRNYDSKAVNASQIAGCMSFGWVRSKSPVPDELKRKSKQPLFLMKRKPDFGANPRILALEKEYAKLEKKKYRPQPLLGILTFLLALVFLVFAGLEFYFGISSGMDKKKENAAEEAANAASEPTDEEAAIETETATSSPVKDLLDKIETNFSSKITGVFDGKTDEATGEYTEGIADKIGNKLGAPVSYFISGDTLVGIISLILGIIFLIIFVKICKLKAKRREKAVKMDVIRGRAQVLVNEMRRSDITLMSKIQRKQYMWETIIGNALSSALASRGADENDDDIDYDY